MDAVVGVRCCCPSSISANASVWNSRSWVTYRRRRANFPPSAALEDKTNSIEGLKEPFPSTAKKAGSTESLVKLFNITQQNMLYLNKLRLTALQELEKMRRDNDLLLAKVAQLKAQYESSVLECELLQKKLKSAGFFWESESQSGAYKSQRQGKRYLNPFSLWSELLLRIDSMAMTSVVTLGQASALRNLVRKREAETADVYINFSEADDRELSSHLLTLLAPNRRRGVHVIHICTEMDPIAQAGSLGTYITNLCRALRRKGHLVEVILPKYSSANLSCVDDLKVIDSDLFSYFDGEWHKNRIWTGVLNGIAVTLIESGHPSEFFRRESIYDCEDDFERFTYFSRASLEYILKSGKQPNVLHIHNWQTAVVAPLFWEIYSNQGLQNTHILFTCQDFGVQCLQEPSKLSLCGLDPQKLNRPDRLQDNLRTNLVNVLKGGIIYANRVTTVSPLYAHHVLTKEYGHGLDSTLNHHKQKFYGILNGVDVSIWNPSTDPVLPSTYSSEDLSGKGICKSVLRKSLQFPDLEMPKPLVGCIILDVTAQHLEPLKTAMGVAMGRGAEFVFVGGSKSPRMQAVLQDLQQENQSGHFKITYDDSLAHQLLAASDILLCPCPSEPSGQWPLIAMAYGTVPVAQEIFDVRGSVIDADGDPMGGKLEATGFSFCSSQASDMAKALGRAIDRWESDPEGWSSLIQNGMKSNNSWGGKCVEAYEAAYLLIYNS